MNTFLLQYPDFLFHNLKNKMKININSATVVRKITGVILTFGLAISFAFPGVADARLIFTTEDDGVNADAYHLDSDDSSAGDIFLNFGSGAGVFLKYDGTDTFVLSNHLDLNAKELQNFAVENAASAPTCDGTTGGRLYYNTTDNELYFCDANTTTWVKSASASIADDSITGAKLAPAVAGLGLVQDGSGNLDINVDDSTLEINTDTVRVKAGGITTSEILDATILNGDIAAGAITGGAAGVISDNTITADDINTGAITTDEILDATILTGDIAAGAITGGAAGVISDNTITADDINTGAITTDEILDATILNGDIAAAAIVGGSAGVISDNTITADDLATDSVAADEIAAGAVGTSEIADGTVAFVDVVSRNVAVEVAPEYPNYTIYADASANKGTLEADHDVTTGRNFYKWGSTKPALNDYDVVFKWTLPENFQSFQATNSIQLDYKSTDGVNTNNKIDLTLTDVDGTTDIPLTSAAGLASATWATYSSQDLSASFNSGDAGQSVILRVKMYAKSSNAAYAGKITFNYIAK